MTVSLIFQKSLNESNEIVETLRHENAGLKEKIIHLEVSAKAQAEKEGIFEKRKKKRDQKDDEIVAKTEEISGLNSALQKRYKISVFLDLWRHS